MISSNAEDGLLTWVKGRFLKVGGSASCFSIAAIPGGSSVEK